MLCVGVSERKPENHPSVYCARYHMLKYFLPSRSCCEPFQMATANGVPAFRPGTCKVTAHLPAEYWACAGKDCPVRFVVSRPLASISAAPRVESQKKMCTGCSGSPICSEGFRSPVGGLAGIITAHASENRSVADDCVTK